MSARILIVEDEKAIQLALRGLLRRDGYDVDLADTGEDALRKLGEAAYDLVITDLALGRGLSGMDVLRATKEARAETAVVMITAHGSEKVAVDAMKQGAEDYLPSPSTTRSCAWWCATRSNAPSCSARTGCCSSGSSASSASRT